MTNQELNVRAAVRRLLQPRERSIHINALVKHFVAKHDVYGFWGKPKLDPLLDAGFDFQDLVRRDVSTALVGRDFVVWGDNRSLVCYKPKKSPHCEHPICSIHRAHLL